MVGIEPYPLAALQRILDDSGAIRGRTVRVKPLLHHFREQYEVPVDTAWARSLEKRLRAEGRSFPPLLPDFLVIRSKTTHKPTIVPVDPRWKRVPSDVRDLYRYKKGLFHELAHVVDALFPGMLSPVPLEVSGHSVAVEPEGLRDVDQVEEVSRTEDTAHDLREWISDNVGLFFMVSPRQFAAVVRERNANNLRVAERFDLSLGDVQAYVHNLLMSSDSELTSVGLQVGDLLRFLDRSQHDPVADLVKTLTGGPPRAEPPHRLMDGWIVDIDLHAVEMMGQLRQLAETHLQIVAAQMAAASPLPFLIDRFIRTHSGSELRFMVRRVPNGPLHLLFELCRRVSPQEHLRLGALLAAKLGHPELGRQSLARAAALPDDPRLLEAAGFCELSSKDDAAAARALALYRDAYILDAGDPEIRFGLAKALGRVEGLPAAEAFLKKVPTPRHWLEDYQLAKIAFSRFQATRSPRHLERAKSLLMTALELPGRWPPKILRQIAKAKLSATVARQCAAEHLDIDADRKKAINLLAKVYQMRSRDDDELRLLCNALLLKSWRRHRLDSKTNFCLYEFYRSVGDDTTAFCRLRELLWLRPHDVAVWAYLESLVRERFTEWEDYADAVARLIQRLSRGTYQTEVQWKTSGE